MTDFQYLINKSIKNLRLSLGLSQEKFSEKCGISSDNYRNLEYNRHTPKASTIDKICHTFNLSPIDLLQYGVEKHKNTDSILNSINELSEKQIILVNDFIKMIKSHKF